MVHSSGHRWLHSLTKESCNAARSTAGFQQLHLQARQSSMPSAGIIQGCRIASTASNEVFLLLGDKSVDLRCCDLPSHVGVLTRIPGLLCLDIVSESRVWSPMDSGIYPSEYVNLLS